jgi:response regulator RpfG family c-di-GMP phosphodiesterase
VSTDITTRLLVVDDDAQIISVVTEALAGEPYDVICLRDPVEALRHLRTHPVDLVLTDLVMGQHTGVQILESALAHHPHVIVILMTAHPTVQTAISVLKSGAYDFLVKPFKLDHLKAAIRRGLAHQIVVRENLSLKSQVQFLSAISPLAAERDIDGYLLRVLDSCRTELSASAVGIIEMNPATRQVLRRIHSVEDDSLIPLVLSTDGLYELADLQSGDPISHHGVTPRGKGEADSVTVSMPIMVNGSLHGVINLVIFTKLGLVTAGQMDVLRILAGSAGAAIINYRLYQDIESSYLQSIQALTSAIEARDKYTGGHTDRVTVLARELARELGWGSRQMEELTMGCTLHDIGKIAIPDSILNKETSLNADERERMLRHPLEGLKIIANIDRLKPAIPYILSHHERWDGRGYPRGLRGENIPIEGRLLAVADTFDAILSDRPYRRGATATHALDEIERSAGTQLDPEIVAVFLDMVKSGRLNLRALYGPHKDLSDLVIPAVNQKELA